jgi:hypothetical protein
MAYLEYSPTSPLYYYAPVAGFEGIVRSKSLWLSDISASNDPRELKLGQELLAEAVNSFEEGSILGVTKRDLASLLSDILRLSRTGRIFTCCFALDGDQLTMWREYAANATGVSIGFRPTAISAIPGRMQLVRYSDDDAREYFRTAVIQAAMAMGKPNTVNRVLAAAELYATVISLKHRTWAHEREARISISQRVAKPDANDLIMRHVSEHPDGTEFEWKEPSVRHSRGGEVLYLEIPFGRWVRGVADPRRAIEVVYRGPNCGMSAAEITALLTSEGFENFRVVQSECEIR